MGFGGGRCVAVVLGKVFFFFLDIEEMRRRDRNNLFSESGEKE